MKKSDLKRVIKPLVKECIHEVLLEEGLLSNVVSEVAKGLSSNVVVEAKTPAPKPSPSPEQAAALSEHRRKLMQSITKDAYNGVDLFENTTPIENPTAGKGEPDLGSPTDPDVDISSILGTSSEIWKRLNQE